MKRPGVLAAEQNVTRQAEGGKRVGLGEHQVVDAGRIATGSFQAREHLLSRIFERDVDRVPGRAGY
jgi:hypothetical protein